MDKPSQRAFSPHISRGCTAQQNSQPVNPSMWPQLSSPLEHFFLSLSLLLLSWCALDWTAHILVASASELASHLTRPVTVSASCIPRTRLTLALIPCPCSGDS